MRIISGKYKGKKIDGYDIEGTRPTQDRIKESLFGIIQNDIIQLLAAIQIHFYTKNNNKKWLATFLTHS